MYFDMKCYLKSNRNHTANKLASISLKNTIKSNKYEYFNIVIFNRLFLLP